MSKLKMLSVRNSTMETVCLTCMIAEAQTRLGVRIVMIGSHAVGKTSISESLVNGFFSPDERATVAANYMLYVREANDVRLEMQIWDTSGHERFRSLGPIYYRNAAAAVAVFDVTSKDSFLDMKNWIDDFISLAGRDVYVAIAANKCDLEDALDGLIQKAENFAKSRNFLFMKTSAKTGEGIRELFGQLADVIISGKWANRNRPPSSVCITSDAPSDQRCSC